MNNQQSTDGNLVQSNAITSTSGHAPPTGGTAPSFLRVSALCCRTD